MITKVNGDGGQSGSLPPLSHQYLSKSNSQICPTDNASVSNGAPNKIEVAAAWLARNREAVRGPVLPFLRRTFDLTSLQAIEASKLAHRMEYEG